MTGTPNVGNKHRPLVSIGMPVYNGAKFIREALDSLLAQTFTDFELIISDNASTDDTEAICREYAAKDPRIRYVRQNENRGAAANFKFVLDEAVGEYFMWAAADDVWDEKCIEKWVEILNIDKDTVLAFSYFYVFYHYSQSKIPAYVNSSVHSTVIARLLMRMFNPISNLIYGMFRRRAFSDMDVEEFDYYDIYFGYAMAIKGKIAIYPDFLFYAGVKGTHRRPYSVTGGKISVKRFLLKTKRLIDKTVPLRYRAFFYFVLIRQSILFHMHIRKNTS